MTEEALNTTRENFVTCAQRLSQKIEEAFVFEMKNAQKLWPVIDGDTKDPKTTETIRTLAEDQLFAFTDYGVGTLAALLSHYASTEKEFEDFVVDKMREKFELLRKIKPQD